MLIVSVVLVALFVAGPLWFAVQGLLQASRGVDWQALGDPYLWHIVWFSGYQAFLSTCLSAIAGVLLGRCLFYLKPKGRQYWLAFASVCFIAPVILVVLGTVGSFGSQGLWASLLGHSFSIYGLSGILLAHLFLNIPLFMRHSYLLWQSIALAQWRQAEQLGLGTIARFRYLEWPMLKSGLIGSMLLVFMLCFGSFTIVLALGGGPAATTLEVAIYQALRYDFEPGFALICALLQLFIGLGLYLLLKQRPETSPPGNEHDYQPPLSRYEPLWMRGYLLIAFCFFGSIILGMILPLRVSTLGSEDFSMVLVATMKSLQIALLSLGIAALLLVALLYWVIQSVKRPNWYWFDTLSELVASALLLFPPMVVSTGIFFWLWQRGRQGQSLWLVALINALMALPFAIRLMRPALSQLQHHYRQLLEETAPDRWTRWWVIYRPILLRPAALTAAFILVLSLGDMGVVALLGDVDLVTLPLLVYQQLGHYQYAQASFTGLWLMLLCTVIFIMFEQIATKGSHVRG